MGEFSNTDFREDSAFEPSGTAARIRCGSPNRKRPGANSEPLLAYPQLPEVKLIPTSGLLRSGLGALVQDGKSFIGNAASVFSEELDLSAIRVRKLRNLQHVGDRDEVGRDLGIAFLNGGLPGDNLVVDGLLILEAESFRELRLDRAVAAQSFNLVLVLCRDDRRPS